MAEYTSSRDHFTRLPPRFICLRRDPSRFNTISSREPRDRSCYRCIMRAILPLQEIEEEEDSGCESEGQILTPPSSPGSGQGHSNSSHSSSGSSTLDVHNLNLHGTGGRSAIVRVTTGNSQGVTR